MDALAVAPKTFKEVVESDLRRAARLVIKVQDEIDPQLRRGIWLSRRKGPSNGGVLRAHPRRVDCRCREISQRYPIGPGSSCALYQFVGSADIKNARTASSSVRPAAVSKARRASSFRSSFCRTRPRAAQ